MELGMIGLGRMGTSMVRRLLRAGHHCVVYDLHPEAVQALAKEGAVGTTSLEDFAHQLKKPRAVWMMVPAAAVDPTLESLFPLLEREDVVIDGGNSHYHDDIRRAAELKPQGIHYVDVGTSGGVWGSERGYCQMIGGDEAPLQRLDPIFAALAPSVEAAPRTPGREKMGGSAEHGYLHCGPSGASADTSRSNSRNMFGPSASVGAAPRRLEGDKGPMRTSRAVTVVHPDSRARIALRALLESHRCTVATDYSCADLVSGGPDPRPDVILLDRSLLEREGVGVLSELNRKWDDTEIVVLPEAVNGTAASSAYAEQLLRNVERLLDMRTTREILSHEDGLPPRNARKARE